MRTSHAAASNGSSRVAPGFCASSNGSSRVAPGFCASSPALGMLCAASRRSSVASSRRKQCSDATCRAASGQAATCGARSRPMASSRSTNCVHCPWSCSVATCSTAPPSTYKNVAAYPSGRTLDAMCCTYTRAGSAAWICSSSAKTSSASGARSAPAPILPYTHSTSTRYSAGRCADTASSSWCTNTRSIAANRRTAEPYRGTASGSLNSSRSATNSCWYST